MYHHRRQPSQNEKGYDFFILLHPNKDSISDKRILNGLGIFEDSRLQPGLSRNEARDQSILVHSLVLSSFICNWRWYLRYLGDRFEEYVGFTISQRVSDHLTSLGQAFHDSTMTVGLTAFTKSE